MYKTESTIVSSHLHHKTLEKQTKNTVWAQCEHTYPTTAFDVCPVRFDEDARIKEPKYCETTRPDTNRGEFFIHAQWRHTHTDSFIVWRGIFSFISHNPQRFHFISCLFGHSPLFLICKALWPTKLQSEPFIHLAFIGTIPNTRESHIFVCKISFLHFLYSFWDSVSITGYSPERNSLFKYAEHKTMTEMRWWFSYAKSRGSHTKSNGPFFSLLCLARNKSWCFKTKFRVQRNCLQDARVLRCAIVCFITESTMDTTRGLWTLY